MCENVRFALGGTKVECLDQTRLPQEQVYVQCGTVEECCDAIARLAVRGAPAIGIFAAFSIAALAEGAPRESYGAFAEYVEAVAAQLAQARPTAVNLAWACGRMVDALHGTEALGRGGAWDSFEARAALRACAMGLQNDDVAACAAMAEAGLALVGGGATVMTICNAGPLATSRYGTALGPALLAQERGEGFHVFACETRPLLQGARLTTYELMRAGVDVTLICDSIAASVMGGRRVDACFVGADRIAANGDTANKVGTAGLAIIAAHFGVPFYVVAPTSTIDLACATGGDIPIELRAPEEVTELHYAHRMAPEGVAVYNPSFDVTEAGLVTAIITERGVVRPPYAEGLAALF